MDTALNLISKKKKKTPYMKKPPSKLCESIIIAFEFSKGRLLPQQRLWFLNHQHFFFYTSSFFSSLLLRVQSGFRRISRVSVKKFKLSKWWNTSGNISWVTYKWGQHRWFTLRLVWQHIFTYQCLPLWCLCRLVVQWNVSIKLHVNTHIYTPLLDLSNKCIDYVNQASPTVDWFMMLRTTSRHFTRHCQGAQLWLKSTNSKKPRHTFVYQM